MAQTIHATWGGGAQLENGAVEAEMGAIWALCWKKVSVRASVKNLFSIDVSREEGCSCVCVGRGLEKGG